jgi:Tol biopolymer transport system component
MSDAPDAPSVPNVAVAAGQLTVTWTAVSGAESYQVYFGTTDDSGTASQYGGDFTADACLLTGLANGTPYYVWVKAKNSIGVSGFSPSSSGTPASSILNASDVVFAYGNNSTDTEILRMNDSSGTTQLVAPATSILLALPSVSLDRTILAYLFFNEFGDEYLKFRDSGGTVDITPATNFRYFGDLSMSLSPDGSKLVYIDYNFDADYNPNYHIWVISTGSSSPTPVQLTNCTTGMDNYPTWSPDGTQIAFVHIDSDSNAKIYSIKADGSSTNSYGNELFSWDTTSLGNESLIHLAWSPTNPYQMVCSSRQSSANPKFSTYTLNLTTKERTKLTSNTGQHELFPRWSKDGNYIFYQIDNNIYYNSINNSGSAGNQMTTDGKSSFYGWSPS